MADQAEIEKMPGQSNSEADQVAKKAKEQITFVSGSMVVLGLLTFKIWPVACHWQTGEHVRLWTTAWSPAKNDGAFMFYFLLLALGFAAMTLLLSVIHIAIWGFWLALAKDISKPEEGIQTKLLQWSQETYSALFLFVCGNAAMYGLYIPVYWALAALLSKIHVSYLVAAFVAAALVFFVPLLVARRYLKKRMSSKWADDVFEWLFDGDLWLHFQIVLALALVVFLVGKEFAYTLDLRMNQQVFSQRNLGTIEALVTLGGSTSDPSVAILTLQDSSGKPLKALEKLGLGGGEYVSLISTSELVPGRYRLALEYPQWSLTSQFPHFRSNAVETCSFVLLP
jgi:hypothetical protein